MELPTYKYIIPLIAPDNNVVERYQAVRRMSKIKGKEYALTKHWFLQSYPAYKEKAIAEQELHALLPKEETSVLPLPNAANL